MAEFFQDGPQLGNQYREDRSLQWMLRRYLTAEVLADVDLDLDRFGDRVVGDIAEMARDAATNLPRLIPYDPWGRRIDHIETARGWQQLDRVSAEEGIVATAYERKHGAYSRIHQLAKLYLFNPSSAIYSCPLAMTDGAARLIEVHGDEYLKSRAFPRLTSRDPSTFWTSGQWMTERTGGSDVGGTSTIAHAEGVGNTYHLHGTKWFTSATTSQMAMTLARIADGEGQSIEGSRGLSLFYLETRGADGQLNNIALHRLKDKLGTKALPTAELTMNGTVARLIGRPGEGVKRIVTLVNVTRVYNSVCAVSGMRRAIALARDYARRRSAFGRPLSEQPLHVETLAQLQVEYEAGLALVFHVASLMGKEECGEANEQESAVLRILTPLAKLYTAKQVVSVSSEVLEAFGGAGYVEDTGLPALLRDSQVLSIWEGTTNVLSLDVLRSMAKEGTLPPLLEHLSEISSRSKRSPLADEVGKITRAIEQIRGAAMTMGSEGPDFSQSLARRFAFSLARTGMATLLVEHARWSLEEGLDARAVATARRFCEQDLVPLATPDRRHRDASLSLALDEELLEAELLRPSIAGKR